jgi:hypothetical protein
VLPSRFCQYTVHPVTVKLISSIAASTAAMTVSALLNDTVLIALTENTTTIATRGVSNTREGRALRDYLLIWPCGALCGRYGGERRVHLLRYGIGKEGH